MTRTYKLTTVVEIDDECEATAETVRQDIDLRINRGDGYYVYTDKKLMKFERLVTPK